MRIRWLVRLDGVVQGVGFRPFAYGLARELGLVGSVANDAQGVCIEVEGEAGPVADFVARLRRDAPPLALIDSIVTRSVPLEDGDVAFEIRPSVPATTRTALVSPDVATCEACLDEIFDPTARRHRYAFTNCTRCGPRFTIVRDIPYDRARTTMVDFTMCAACRREYHDPADRRFHAQPIACPACGPRLTLRQADGRAVAGDPLAATAAALRAGQIVAVKGLGGYHLAAVADDASAVAALRARKRREDKPFAVMVADVSAARALAGVDPDAERLLASRERPIVIVPRRPHARVAAAVAPGHTALGLLLPYTPLHHLLLREVDAPIVFTSGNVSDEPIVYRDDEAREHLGGIADLLLTHDRLIHVRTDDSVVRACSLGAVPVRRARGYAPRPIRLPWALQAPVLACGAELKSTICVARDDRAFLSHHLGDLENYEAYRAFTEAIEHLGRLFAVEPAIIAHDLHPEYLSTKWAREQPARLLGVQHHHAHVVACLVDNGETGPVIGVAFDGLGYGTDGTLWGGEFLLARVSTFSRLGHLATVPMPGGTTAIREPWRMAAAYLHGAFGRDLPALPLVRRRASRWAPVVELIERRVNAPLTSSAGRLFDAVAAILNVRDIVSYEGQAAIELEQLAATVDAAPYPLGVVQHADSFELCGADVVRAVADDVVRGVAPAVVAARFHETMTSAIALGCRAARERSGLTTVALSGGVFQNTRLLVRTLGRLEADGFRVLRHRRVPPNDGGISLGQAAVAGWPGD
jgi:hydrogenase maturation protein HypF